MNFTLPINKGIIYINISKEEQHLKLPIHINSQDVARITNCVEIDLCIAIEMCHWEHDMEKQWLLIKLKKKLLAQE